jgi:hypothetical protein
MNTQPSYTTKIPPFEALIRVVPKAQLTLIQNETPVWARKEQLITICKKAHNAILHSQMMMIKDTTFVTHCKGDQVWLDAKNLKMTHSTHKLWAKRYGSFKVNNVLSHVVYQLQLPKTWKIHNVFHASYLSPYKETVEHGPNFLEPPSDLIKGQPEWEVEAIIGMHHFGPKRKKQYHVHWKGYSNAKDTWEPEENIHAPELITQYHKSQEMNIRATKMETKTSMIKAGHLVSPREHPLFLRLLSPLLTSEISNPKLAEVLCTLAYLWCHALTCTYILLPCVSPDHFYRTCLPIQDSMDFAIISILSSYFLSHVTVLTFLN